MLFKRTVCSIPKEVGTQYEDLSADNWGIVEDCLCEMFEDGDGFVVLTLAEISHNVRYVQAHQQGDGIIVQLGVEVEGGTKLVEKLFTEKECMDIFHEFYETTDVHNIDQYKEARF